MNSENENEHLTNNQHALKHGAEGALRRKNEGKPFLGLAADTEKAVTNELDNAGIHALVRRDAIRMQTISDLYYSAVLKAAQDGDLNALDRYVARYGWIQSATLRALAQVAADEKDAAKGASVSTIDAIASLRRAKNGKANPE